MANPLDLFGSWREALQRWEQDTNAALNAATSDERYSRAMNQSLAVMARLQAAHAENVEKALGRANLPSRADFRQMDARFDSLERQVAELTDMVRRLTQQSGAVASRPAGPIPRPARTRKPPSAAAPALVPEPDSASAVEPAVAASVEPPVLASVNEAAPQRRTRRSAQVKQADAEAAAPRPARPGRRKKGAAGEPS